MTDLDRTLTAFLQDDSAARVPAHLDEVLAVTSRTRQRPAWSSLERWLPVDLALPRTSSPLLSRRPLVLVLLLALIASAIAIVGSQLRRVPPPYGLAANGDILLDGGTDVLVLDANGGNLRTLIGGDTNDSGVFYTRDGTRFLFLRQTDGDAVQPMVANADGSGIRPVTTEPLHDVQWYEWSPTGDRVAFVHVVDGKRTLSIVDIADRTSLREIPLRSGFRPEPNVQWRPPDGAELILTVRPAGGTEADSVLVGVRPDGSGFRVIAGPSGGQPPYGSLTLSPDGDEAAYWQYDPDDSPAGFTASVHLVDLETGDDRIERFVDDVREEAELAYGPDGASALIVRCEPVCRLALVPLDHSAPPRAIGPEIPGDQKGRGHGFSPDGRTVLLHLDGEKPLFIDVATGDVTEGPVAVPIVGSWQRLAP